MSDRIYLDWNASTPLRPEARAAMAAAWELSGNPSSVHAEGRQARRLVEEARARVAGAVGASPRDLVFTSGGTEANALALTPGLRRGSGHPVQRLLVSAIEHASVLSGGRFPAEAIEQIGVTRWGLLDLDHLRALLAGGPPALVSVMLANNETGVIQPLREVVALAQKHGALVHTDAVQAFGKIPVNFGLLGVDMMTIAAHKVGGPPAIGALVLRDGLPFEPFVVGGGQELRRRAGTENLVAIAGFAALARENLLNAIDLRNQLESSLEGAVIFAQGAERLPNTTNFAHAGLGAETLLMNFDLEGVAVSSGSACSSGKVTRSHVLTAMGVDADLARGAIRISLGWNTTPQNIEHFTRVWRKLLARHQAKAAA